MKWSFNYFFPTGLIEDAGFGSTTNHKMMMLITTVSIVGQFQLQFIFVNIFHLMCARVCKQRTSAHQVENIYKDEL